MIRFSSFAVVLIILIFSNASFGQKTDEELKQKQKQEIKLLYEILADANNLRLAENKALVYAEVGNKIWYFDQKKGRELFELAIDELIKAQNDASLETKNKQNLRYLIYGQHPRINILNLIATRDAEFALDVLEQTRSNKLLVALDRFRQKQQNSDSSFFNHFRYSSIANYARSEIASEQRFIALAAQQNPERMAELFRKGLEKGVNYKTIRLLQQIHLKDAILAGKLVEEAVEKLLSLKISDDGTNAYTFVYFLDTFGHIKDTDNRSLKISASSIRNIADKLSNFWLSSNQTSININSRSYKLIEKLFPSRTNALKKKNQNANKQLKTQNNENKRYQELLKTKPSGAELIKQVKNFSNYRSSIFNSAINKLAEEGNLTQAVSLVKTQFPEDKANQRLTQIYTNLANKEASKGNFESAISYINEIPDEERRFNPMLQLANSIYYKNREENKEYAISVLQQLDSFIDSDPKTSNELSKITSLANTYLQLNPNQSFRLLETVIEPLNQYSKALTITSQFSNDGRVRDGELLISMGIVATGQFNLAHLFQTLKRTNYSQTVQLMNRFEQNEVRISLKLKLVNSVGNDQMTKLPISTRTPILKGRKSM